MRIFYVLVLLCCVQSGLCQFGFFQQRDDNRRSPFQIVQNLLPNPNQLRNNINQFLHLQPHRPIATNGYQPDMQVYYDRPVVFPTNSPGEAPNQDNYDQNNNNYFGEEPRQEDPYAAIPPQENQDSEQNMPTYEYDNAGNQGDQPQEFPINQSTENPIQDEILQEEPKTEGYDEKIGANERDTTTLAPLTPVAIPSFESRNSGTNFSPFSATCQTVENEVGNCINLLKCEPYVKIVKEFRNNPAAVQLLRKAHCGFEGNNPKVCCPLPGFSTVPPEPVTTTTTTTVAPVPTPASKTVGQEFVSAFPEPPICGVSNASFSRVVGGIDGKLGDFPWMALLGYRARRGGGVRWLCGGSLVTSRHVLTAAHCIHGREDDLYLVRLGELDLSRDDEGATPVDILIKQLIKHEQYSNKSYTNDIGVLLLEKEVTFTELIKPICLPQDSQLRSLSFENYNPIIAGWGDTEFRGPSSPLLQVLQLPVVSNDFCTQAYSPYKAQKIDERVLCAGFKQGGKDACQGDSGGPLMQPIWNSQTYKTYFYQIGVVSYGKKCAEAGFPGVYSRVTHFIPWLQEKILGHA